jgi:signal-transduction protein with cAMP-binding, CBS, and nucleotidyltransferase domain
VKAVKVLGKEGIIFSRSTISEFIKARLVLFNHMVNSASEVMTTKIQTIDLEDNALAAAKKMMNKNVSSLIVVDKNDQAVGIVTERDLVREVCAQDGNCSQYVVQHIMSSPIVTIDPNSSVETAANIMMQNKVRHLVVVDEKKTLGIITSSNFISYLNQNVDLDDVNARILEALLEESPETQSAGL